MFESSATESQGTPSHHVRWFLIGGVLGLAIAVISVVLWLNDTGLHNWLLVSCPFGLMLFPAIMDGSTGLLRFVVVIVPVMNFALWGICFLLVSMLVSFVRNFGSTD